MRRLPYLLRRLDRVTARRQPRPVVTEPAYRHPKAATVLEQGKDPMTLPKEPWSKISPTNPPGVAEPGDQAPP